MDINVLRVIYEDYQLFSLPFTLNIIRNAKNKSNVH